MTTLQWVLSPAIASVVTIFVGRIYLKKKEPLRFGGIGTTVLLLVIWLVVFGITFFLLIHVEPY